MTVHLDAIGLRKGNRYVGFTIHVLEIIIQVFHEFSRNLGNLWERDPPKRPIKPDTIFAAGSVDTATANKGSYSSIRNLKFYKNEVTICHVGESKLAKLFACAREMKENDSRE